MSILILLAAIPAMAQEKSNVRAMDSSFRPPDMSKIAREDAREFKGKGFNADKSALWEKKEYQGQSYQTKEYLGSKGAGGMDRTYSTSEAMGLGRESSFSQKESPISEKGAHLKNGGVASDNEKTFDSGSQSSLDARKSYDRQSREYLGPEAKKMRPKINNVDRENLTVEEVRELINRPGSSRQSPEK
ncbi:MAG: hypothetical protein SFY92_06790 [Verrucomicrobiae bacterium]|nr:hypothetical protein [Verrucomicrobiae bacterium]